jgi:hypothetical protein
LGRYWNKERRGTKKEEKKKEKAEKIKRGGLKK